MESNKSINIWVISNCRPNSGWGTYVDNLKYTLEDNARFLNLFGSIESNNCLGEPAIVSGVSKFRPFIARSIPK